MKKLSLAVIFALVLTMIFSMTSLATSYPQGDVNMDGTKDSTDLTTLKKIVMGFEDETDLSDVNADGSIDVKDLVRLKKIMSKTSSTIDLDGGDGAKTVITDDWN